MRVEVYWHNLATHRCALTLYRHACTITLATGAVGEAEDSERHVLCYAQSLLFLVQ